MSYEEIIFKEITEKKSPFIIRRPLPNNVFEDFIQKSNTTIDALCAASEDIAIVVGAPSANPVP